MTDSHLIAPSYEALLARNAELQATVLHLQATIAELLKRISALEHLLGTGGSSGMPGNKPEATKPKPPAKERKKRAQGFGRPRLPPTQTVQHAVAQCPECHTPLVGGWVQRTREVIEIPIAPVEVIDHQYIARVCPLCEKRRVPPVDLAGVVAGKRHRLGLRLVSVIATLREEGRLPLATIQWYLQTFHQLHLSQGAIVTVLHQVAQQAKQTLSAIQIAIQTSPIVHSDETGWREQGKNGFVWTFSTPTERFFVRRRQTKEVVDEILGPLFTGTLVSDFYAAYHPYPGIHQRCWAHLLRDIHTLTEIYPTNVSLTQWATRVLALFHEGLAFEHPDERERQAQQRDLEERLLVVCQPFLDDPLAVQRKLCRRIDKHQKELFVFVGDPQVPATNNAAERSLRHLVTSRKISGGTQSPAGTTTKMTLATVFGTWRLRDLNPLQQCQLLFTSPYH
jgi:transposase